jgi:AraC-like DNA-binding protein
MRHIVRVDRDARVAKGADGMEDCFPQRLPGVGRGVCVLHQRKQRHRSGQFEDDDKNAGINEFKLKHGFKEVFKNTVFGYLSDYKLLKAKELLADSSKDIKSISDELGYSSVQHFSNAFSKKFGISPGKAR